MSKPRAAADEPWRACGARVGAAALETASVSWRDGTGELALAVRISSFGGYPRRIERGLRRREMALRQAALCRDAVDESSKHGSCHALLGNLLQKRAGDGIE